MATFNRKNNFLQIIFASGTVLLAFALIFGSNLLLKSPTKVNQSSAAVQPYGQPAENWMPVFAEDFSTNVLNTSLWHTCFWWATNNCAITSNGDEQLYWPGNVVVGSGFADLTAKKEDTTSWDNRIYHYTSGMIITGGRKYEKPPGFKFKYGYIEARVKVPKGNGLGPAIWTLPIDCSKSGADLLTCNYDLSRPEIDIMEIFGGNSSRVLMNYHYTNTSGNEATLPTYYTPTTDFSADYHYFAVDWQPTQIIWYIDGVERKRLTDTSILPKTEIYLILNLTVGGWTGTVDASTLPKHYLIDYVRVWQRISPSPTPAVTSSPTPNVRPGTCICSNNNVVANGCYSNARPKCLNPDVCKCSPFLLK